MKHGRHAIRVNLSGFLIGSAGRASSIKELCFFSLVSAVWAFVFHVKFPLPNHLMKPMPESVALYPAASGARLIKPLAG